MNAGWVVTEAASNLLSSDEREAVLGDLLESSESGWQALFGVLGLALRREVQRWKSWRPWVAAFGLALPASFLLMGLSLSVSCMFPQVLHALAGIQPHENLVFWSIRTLAPQVLMLTGFSFAGGYALVSLSRRTLWASTAACILPCLFCLARFRIESLSWLCLLVFLLPAIWGVREGLHGWRIGFKSTLGLATGLTVLGIFSFHSPSIFLIPIFLIPLLWPVWYVAAVARRTTAQT